MLKKLNGSVKEIFVNYVGQGLTRAGRNMIVGNGHNRYVMCVEYLNKTGTVIFEEKHILHWETTSINEEDGEYDSFKFQGYGMLNGEYYPFFSTNCDDFDHLILIDSTVIEFKICEVKVENCTESTNSINFRSYKNCIEFNEWQTYYDEEIRKLMREQNIRKGIKRIDYNTFINNPGNYFIMNDDVLIPFSKISTGHDVSDIVIYGKNVVMKHENATTEDDDDFWIECEYENKFLVNKKIKGLYNIGQIR